MNGPEKWGQKDSGESHLKIVDDLLTGAQNLAANPRELVPSLKGLIQGSDAVLDLLAEAEENLDYARDFGANSEMIKKRKEKIAMIRFGLPTSLMTHNGEDRGGMTRVKYRD